MKTIFTTTDISDKLSQVLDKPHELSAKIVTQMHAGVAHFAFYKKGKKPTDPPVLREAYGTLKRETLEKILGPQEESSTPSEPVPNSEQTLQTFFDVEAMAFRSYTIANLICLY